MATSGIYGRKELDDYRYQSLFAAEKQSLLNNIAYGADGHHVDRNDISMFNLLDQDTLNKIAESTGKKIWDGLLTFGTLGAAVYAISVIFTLIKYVVDTMIHGYALHSAYGCSTQVIGAIWGALATLLLHRNASKTPCNHCQCNQVENEKKNEKEREEIIVQRPDPLAVIASSTAPRPDSPLSFVKLRNELERNHP